MKASLFFLFILMACSGLQAQDVTVRRGSRISDVLTTSDIFFYPQFTRGKVFYRDGTVAAANMNYHSLLDQMLFIDPKGDTLALTNEKTFHFIAFEKDTFYFVDGYVRLVSNNGVVKIAERSTWQIADIKKTGSHNRSANTYAVSNYQRITDGLGRTYDLEVQEDMVLRKKPQYYFGDMYNQFLPAAKKSLLSIFSKNESVLVHYLKENKVNFHSRQDLDQLAQFLQQNY